MRKILVGLTTAALIASTALPALAIMPFFPMPQGSHDITVTNSSSAFVSNNVTVKADTGDNDADGDDGGDGGNGGDADNNHNAGGAQTNSGGNGGAGGVGGNGGTIVTGDATAGLYLGNQVNDTKTVVDACACPEEDDECGCESQCQCGGWYGYDDDCGCVDDITVSNYNFASVMNSVYVKADTGDNEAEGDDGGDGGDGGDADNNWNKKGCHRRPGGCYGYYGFGFGGNQTNDGGNGGKGGNGGSGGTIVTGDAWAGAEIVNVVNSVVNRILR